MVDSVPSLVVSIDPGTEVSGYVVLRPGWSDDEYEIVEGGVLPNAELIERIPSFARDEDSALVVEQIKSYGQVVGQTTFETVLWSGRFIERWLMERDEFYRIPRKDAVKYVTGSGNGKDADVFRCLKERFGEPGKKTDPGFLYGLTNDARAALAVALTLIEGNKVYIPER